MTLKISALVLTAAISEHARGEKGMKQESGVARLGSDTGDTRDVDVGAALAVEKLEVDEERLAAAAEPDRKALLHAIEEEGLIAFGALGYAHRLPGEGRHEHLGLEPGRRDLGGLGHLGRQEPLFDQEDVGIEAGAFVAGPDLADHPVDVDDLASREVAFERDDVVELEKPLRIDPHPELERGGVFGSDYPTDHLFHHSRE